VSGSNGYFKCIAFAVLVLTLTMLRTSCAAPHAAPSPHRLDNLWTVLAHATQAPTSAVPLHIIEQYKTYVADLGSVGAQVATTETLCLTMISGLIAVLAFKETPRTVQHFITPAAIVVFGFICLVCVAWALTMLQFNNLFAAKFEVLRSMEHRHHDLFPMFIDQTDYYERELTSGFIPYGIIKHLLLLPITFGLISFAVFVVGLVVQIRRASKPADSTPAAPLQAIREPLID
jgi:hypothetical protein